MSKFPRVVVWDASKAHHYSIAVDKSTGVIQVACFECESAWCVKVEQSQDLRRWIAADEEVQVVVWIEFDVR